MKFYCPHCKKTFKRDMRKARHKECFIDGRLITTCEMTGKESALKPLKASKKKDIKHKIKQNPR